MRRVLLIIGAVFALLLAGCGGDDSSTDSTGPSAEKPFRIPVGSPPIKEEKELKFKPNGLVGEEPKPVWPEGPPPDFLAVQDIWDGIGNAATPGSTITVQYVGYDYETKKKFDSSWDQGEPLTLTLGKGEVIPGWEEGILGMEVSDRRELVIPPDLGYGEQEVGSIKPNSTLVFVIDLLDVKG
ncbi:MAG: FKBP-type peptidyl-prolyl cis-trans isomerase [Actinomycetota bacterium]|nr:FKBP-type peptidyl-prolyl cis-trans isomerase [Actinomycetota bacterium]